MRKNYIPHRSLLKDRISRSKVEPYLLEMYEQYLVWAKQCNELNSDEEKDLKEKIHLLNEYKNSVDDIAYAYLKQQDKLPSSIMEEFLFYLFKDITDIKPNIDAGLVFLGSARAYTDLSFAPKNLQDFVTYPNVFINYKNQDFTISKMLKCTFDCNGQREEREIIVPAVAIECKTYIPSTMLRQSIYEAQLLKQGNPYALYMIVAEQNALSDDVNLKNIPIDEIFILRKQKRNSAKNKTSDKNPMDYQVFKELYDYVKEYLNKDWFNNQKATERGRLIKTQ